MRIDAIIYDFDGTMVDTEFSVWCASSKEFLARHGIEYDHHEIKHLLSGKSMEEGVAIMQNMYDIQGDRQELTAERVDIVHGLLGNVEYIDGFREFFESHNCVPSAIATSMQREFFSRIDNYLGASGLVDHVSCLEDVNASKPNPDIFLHAAKAIGVKPQYCVAIEDSQNGIDSAWNAGMRVIGMRRAFPDILADIVVDSYAEIDLSVLGPLNRHSRR